jgi:hypothetical protein
MLAEARKFSIQKIRRIGWHVLGIGCFMLVPISEGFAATKPAAKAAHAASVRYRHHSFGIGVFGIMGFPHPPARPTIYQAPPAVVYIEKDALQDNPPEYVWYYCRSLQTYYPYIVDCPESWEEIKPTTNVENSPANTK